MSEIFHLQCPPKLSHIHSSHSVQLHTHQLFVLCSVVETEREEVSQLSSEAASLFSGQGGDGELHHLQQGQQWSLGTEEREGTVWSLFLYSRTSDNGHSE